MTEFDNNTNNSTNTSNGFEETTTTGPIGNVDNTFQIPESATILAKPDSGRIAIDTDANSTYAISFDPNDAQLALENGDLVFNFNDGTQLILGDFAEVSPMPTIMLSDGTILAGDVVVAQLQDPSTDVFNLETAAGATGGAGGQFSYDDDLGSVIDLIDNLPPLPFTTLAFSTFEREEFQGEDLPGTFIPKFFTPFAAGVAGGFEDWQPNQHVGDLTEFPMQLVIDYTPPAGDNDVVDSINIADIPTDVRVFVGTQGVPGSFVELPVAGGEVDITTVDLAGRDIFMLPPENSDADFTVTVNLETRDPDTNEVTILSEPAVAVIDAVADKPEIDGTVELADGTIDGSAVTGTDGQNVKFNVDIDFFDNDGSETHTITVTGVPQGWTLVNDGGLGATATPQADGTVTHTVTVGAGFDGTMEFNPGTWNSGDFGTAEVTFTAHAEEVEFDEELLLTNNEAETEQTFQVTLTDDVPEVILVSGPAVIPEDDLTIPGPDTVDGTITVDFFSDAPGSLTLTTDGLDALDLTSQGEELSYEVSPDGLVLTATDEGGNPVFTVTLNDTPVTNGTEETYTYTFELLQPLDHETGGATDALIDIPVQFIATDSDGDTTEGQIDLQVIDDIPTVQDTNETVDETTDLGVPVNGTIPVDFGADGGEIDGSDIFTSSVPLISDGQPVTVDYVDGVYTATNTDGDTVFTATLNDDGTYTFVQELPLDHPDTTDSNDPIELNFGYTATDSEGDVASGSLKVTILDDGPTTEDVRTPVLDETDGLAQTASGTIPFEFGEDGAGSINLVDNFTSTGSVPASGLSSGGEDVTVTLVGDTYTATTPGGETVFTMTINQETGEYDFEIVKPLDHADGSNPNDVINLEFTYEVIDGDGDIVEGTITVPVRDDAPVAVDDGTFTIANDGPQTVDGNALTNDTIGEDVDGSVTQVEFNGTVVTFAADAQTDADGTFVEIDGDYGTLKLYEDGDYTYTVTDAPEGADGTFDPEAFTYTIQDADGDTSSADINFSVENIPTLKPVDVENEVDETFIDQTVSDTITIADATGFALTSDVTSDGSLLGGDLTSNGVPVTTALIGGQIIGSAGGETIFTVDLTEGGEYTFTLLGTLDHADGSDANDVIDLNFTYEATGISGQTVEGTIEIHVLDDAPTAADINAGNLDETDGLSGTLSGTITPDFGEDGEGTIQPNNDFNSTGSQTAGNLSSGGEDVTVTLVGDTYTGTTTGGETVFTMTINDDGSYDFELVKPLDHADGSDANDVIALEFGYTTTDFDGDSANATITVNIVDDVPIAADDFGGNIYNDGIQTVDGNVLANDDGGEDGIGEVTQVTVNGTTISFAADAQTDADGTFIEIDGDYGTLKLYEDGDYTYTVTDTPVGSSGFEFEEFVYTMNDTDTDTDTATLHFCVERAPAIEAVDVENEVDETFIDQTVSDSIVIEGATSFALTNDVDSDGSLLGGDLTSNGVPVTTALIGGQIIGSAGGETIFTVDLTEGGEYTFTLLGTLDHADGSDANDIINLNFTYEATGAGDQTVEGEITIHVLDDAPTAIDDGVFNIPNDGPQTVDGNVLANDDFGQDDAGDVTAISFDGTTVSFETDAQTDADGTFIEIDGQYGTVKLYEGGDFEYTITNPPVGDSGWTGERFEYTMDDYDGDTDTALIKFCVQRVPTIEAVDVENEVDETFIDQTVSDSIVVEGATSFALGDVDGGLDYTSGGSMTDGTLTSNGVAVAVALIGGQIVGSAGGETIFTLDLSNDGTYDFTLLGTLDHADGSNPNDIINLDFTYTVENTFGQAVEGNISIDVLDDIPTPCPDRNVFEGVAADGNVLTGEGSIDGSAAADGFGQDGPGEITQVAFDGTVVSFANDAQTDFHGTFIEIEGENGVLKLYEDGDYQYVLNDVEGTEFCKVFGIDESGISGDPTSITENGITISVGNGDSLTFFDAGPTLGSGIGIESTSHNTPKVYRNESININFDDPTTMVDITVADIGANNAGDSIGVKIYYSATEFIVVEQEMPNPAPANGIVEFTINTDDYSFDSIYEVELFSGNLYGHNCPSSFLLNDVKAYYTTPAEPSADEFTYTISDYDGDEASTTLTFEATDPEADSVYSSSIANSGNLLIENDVADEVFYDESADTLDISDLLSDSGYQPGVSDIADFLQVESNGEVHVDIAGTGSFDNSNVVGTFEGGSTFDTINVVLNDDEGDIPVQIV